MHLTLILYLHDKPVGISVLKDTFLAYILIPSTANVKCYDCDIL